VDSKPSTRSSKPSFDTLPHYGWSVLCPLAALAISLLLRGNLDPALLFLVAVIVPGWIGGIWPGLLSVLLCFIAMSYPFSHPLTLENPQLPQVTFFAIVTVGISWFRRIKNDRASESSDSTGAVSHQLTSWKETADYLGVNVRTAQRWEQQKGLPVKRTSGERGRVMASSYELDRWRAANLACPKPWSNVRFLRVYGLATSTGLLIALGVMLGVWLHAPRVGPPVRLRVEDKEIVVADGEGKERWRHRFPTAIDAGASWFGHLGANTNTDTLLVVHSRPLATSQLLCFSETGKLRWAFDPGKRSADGKLPSPPVSSIDSFRVLPASKESPQRIVLSASHGSNYPDQVAVLDPVGQLIGEYWHSGHLGAMEIAPFGPNGSLRVALAGVDQGRRRATLILLDPGNVHGASVEDDNTYNWTGLGSGTETAILWFERSCVNQATGEFNDATEISLLPGGLQVVVRESRESKAYVTYVLDKDLNLTSVEGSPGFQALHRRLEQTGQLKHKFSEDEVRKLFRVGAGRQR
jgi:hypothetical protein